MTPKELSRINPDMKKVTITVSGESALLLFAYDMRDLQNDLLPNKLGIKKEDIQLEFTSNLFNLSN